MKHLVWVTALLFAFSGNGGIARTGTAHATVVKKQVKSAKKGKNKLTQKETRLLRKKAEREAKKHEMEMKRKEYQQMQEAQRRGMIQMQQQGQDRR